MATNDTLNTRRKEAIKIVEEIKAQSKIIEENAKISNRLLLKIVVDSKEPKKTNSTLKRLVQSSDETISRFRTKRDKISKLLTQVNTFYEKKYLPLVSKIEDKNTGLNARIKLGTQFKNEVIKIKESSKLQYEEIKKYAVSLRKINTELNRIDTSIKRVLLNATTKSNKINELHANITLIDSQATNTIKKLEKLFSESQKNENTLSELLKKANTEFEGIENIKINSEQLLSKIQNIYEIAAETGLSGEFDKRRAHLKDQLKKWERLIFITTTVLLLLIVAMFILQLELYEWDLTNHTFDINFYIRFLIASPIVYYLYFCSSQYNQTKKLHDKYSFKTTLAMSINSHIELLTSHEKFNSPERINKILEFILEGFDRIYSEPYAEDDYKLKLKLANMEIDIEKKLIETFTKTININNK